MTNFRINHRIVSENKKSSLAEQVKSRTWGRGADACLQVVAFVNLHRFAQWFLNRLVQLAQQFPSHLRVLLGGSIPRVA